MVTFWLEFWTKKGSSILFLHNRYVWNTEIIFQSLDLLKILLSNDMFFILLKQKLNKLQPFKLA